MCAAALGFADESRFEEAVWPVGELQDFVVAADRFVGAGDAVSAADDHDLASGDCIGQRGPSVLVEGAGVTAPGGKQMRGIGLCGGEHPDAGVRQILRPGDGIGRAGRPPAAFLTARAGQDEQRPPSGTPAGATSRSPAGAATWALTWQVAASMRTAAWCAPGTTRPTTSRPAR